MKKTLTNLCLMVVMLLIGTTSAFAQFEKKIEQYPRENYDTAPCSFNLTEVATALGTDAATLANAVTSQGNLISLVQSDGTKSQNYTQGSAGGFWMTKDGMVGDWGMTDWYNTIEVNTTTDEFIFWIGQMPGHLVAGDQMEATFELAYNAKTVTFKITLEILEVPVIEFMPDTIAMSDIEIVKEYEYRVTQKPRSNWDGSNYSFEISEGLDLIGIDVNGIAPNLEGLLYVRYWDWSLSAAPNSLTKTSTSLGAIPGWHTVPVYDELTDSFLPEQVGSPQDQNIGNFYIDGFKFDPETKSLSAWMGQNPGKLKGGEELYIYVYFVYNGKAIKMKVNYVIEEVVVVPFEEMTKVGSTTVNLQQIPMGDYGNSPANFDINDVLEKLGCERDDVQFQALAAENELSSNMTANNGYWVNQEGYITNHGNGSAIYCEWHVDSVLTVGQMPNTLQKGQILNLKFYFTYETKYYEVIINIEIIAKPEIKIGEIVGRESIMHYIKCSGEYGGEHMTTQLDLEYITKVIGESSVGYTLYGLSYPDAEGNSSITDAYSCDPKPGFWMTYSDMEETAYVGTWGVNSFGMTYANGIITWWQIPNQRRPGEQFNATFYLNNPETNKALQLDVFIEYTEDYVLPAEVVGEEEVLIALTEDGIVKEFDLTGVATAFDISDPAYIYDSGEIKISKNAIQYTSDAQYYDEADGWAVSKDGFVYNLQTEIEESMTAPARILYELSETTFTLNVFSWQLPEDGEIIRTKVAIEYDGKLYVYNLVLGTEATISSVQDIESDVKTAGNVYDLSGRLVRKGATSVNGLDKGIYILNGKKYLVK